MTHITTLRDLRSCIQADTAHSPATEQLAALDAAIAAMETRPLSRWGAQPEAYSEQFEAACERVLSQPVADEREAFEKWAGVEYRHAEQYDVRDYALGLAAWQARAALAAPRPVRTVSQASQEKGDGQ